MEFVLISKKTLAVHTFTVLFFFMAGGFSLAGQDEDAQQARRQAKLQEKRVKLENRVAVLEKEIQARGVEHQVRMKQKREHFEVERTKLKARYTADLAKVNDKEAKLLNDDQKYERWVVKQHNKLKSLKRELEDLG